MRPRTVLLLLAVLFATTQLVGLYRLGKVVEALHTDCVCPDWYGHQPPPPDSELMPYPGEM